MPCGEEGPSGTRGVAMVNLFSYVTFVAEKCNRFLASHDSTC